MKTLRVLHVWNTDDKGFVCQAKEIPYTLEAMQGLVGGYIETVEIMDGIVIVCNEEGKLLGLPPAAELTVNGEVVDCICGDHFYCRADGDDFADLTDSDVLRIRGLSFEGGNENEEE